MSSRDIAEIVSSRHVDVCRSIERLMKKGAIGEYVVTAYTHPQNHQTYYEFFINQRDSYIIVAQLSPEFTARLVDRWQELEAAAEPKIPTSFAEALQLAANQAKELEVKTQALALAAPKVEFADAIAGADKGVKLGQFAKTVGMGPVTIFRVLRELKILMSGGDSFNLPYQQYVERGYFAVKQGTYSTNSETRISHTAMITGKGEMWLRKKLIETGHLKAVAA
ncbi:phage antirepressor KilAC domain-containing protein [Vibrio alfacsensis]|uniref:phage antirepressor KilAC domain-containing protein n=1 Tax=Vibrio alfacsensis TaxID=1074311 RepID=UPI001CEC37B0|nr:phage antirepressor KilAC domain-containing protein [Vibrio alfacsensis]